MSEIFPRSDFVTDQDYDNYHYAMDKIAAGEDAEFYSKIENSGLVLMANGETCRINFAVKEINPANQGRLW